MWEIPLIVSQLRSFNIEELDELLDKYENNYTNSNFVGKITTILSKRINFQDYGGNLTYDEKGSDIELLKFRNTHSDYYQNITDNAEFPPYMHHCLCFHYIEFNRFIIDKKTNKIYVVGRCCIKKFIKKDKGGRRCFKCTSKHKCNSKYCVDCKKINIIQDKIKNYENKKINSYINSVKNKQEKEIEYLKTKKQTIKWKKDRILYKLRQNIFLKSLKKTNFKNLLLDFNKKIQKQKKIKLYLYEFNRKKREYEENLNNHKLSFGKFKNELFDYVIENQYWYVKYCFNIVYNNYYVSNLNMKSFITYFTENYDHEDLISLHIS